MIIPNHPYVALDVQKIKLYVNGKSKFEPADLTKIEQMAEPTCARIAPEYLLIVYDDVLSAVSDILPEHKKKVSQKILAQIFDQTHYIDKCLSEELPALTVAQFQILTKLVVKLILNSGLSLNKVAKGAMQLFTYSAKHVHSQADLDSCTTIAQSKDINVIHAATIGKPTLSGGSGRGILRDATILIHALSYQFQIIDNNKISATNSMLNYIKERDFSMLDDCEDIEILDQIIDLMLQCKSESKIESTRKLKIIQISTDHANSFEKLIIIPSNTILLGLVSLKNKIEKINESRVSDNNNSKWHISRVGTVADKPQNVSILYEKNFAEGVPRFPSKRYIKKLNKNERKLYRLDLWFEKQEIARDVVEKINESIERAYCLQKMIPNSAKIAVNNGNCGLITSVLINHLKHDILSKMPEKETISAMQKNQESKYGLFELKVGNAVSEEKIARLALALVSKIIGLSETDKDTILKKLKERIANV